MLILLVFKNDYEQEHEHEAKIGIFHLHSPLARLKILAPQPGG
jgi:hypothetical protein